MIVWTREKATGHYIGKSGAKPVARIRKVGSAWAWTFRGARSSLATRGEANLLKRAKQEVEGLCSGCSGPGS